MSHPTRFHAMTSLVEGPATPAEIAAKIDEPLNNVTYHINVLVELGCIELVRTQPARGGRVVEHVYRATKRAYLDDEAWNQLDEKEKLLVDNALVRLISEDIATAMAHGTFYGDDDNHMSRMPMTLDRDGWEEVISLLNETLDELMEIQSRVDDRKAPDEEAEVIPVKVEIIQFRSPSPKTP